MKILQICPHYLPAHRFGGPLKVAHNIGLALKRAGHEVVVCSTNLQDEQADLDVPLDTPVDLEGITVYYEPVSISRYWGFSTALVRRIRMEMADADLVLVHAHFQFANLVGAYMARKAGIPYVIFPHSSLNRHSLSHKNAFLKRVYLSLLERRNLQRARFIAFNAEEEMACSLYQEQGVVIPNGIAPEEFPEQGETTSFRSRYPQLQGRLVFLFLGRLDVEQKGLDLLLCAFARLHEENPDVHLVLAGPDEAGGRARIESLVARHGLAATVSLTGLITGEVKAAALREADAFVLPSRFEGLSMALLEALYMDLPLLVTDRVGLSGKIAETGAGLVVGTDPEEIFAAMQELTDPEVRRRIHGKGRELVLRDHTWDAIAGQLLDALGDLC